MLDNIITLGFLVLLQAVLGFDNLLYISLESKRAPQDEQSRVRKLGIGLAVVKRISERHGGTVELESDPGSGSTFTLVLPRRPLPIPSSPTGEKTDE